MSQQQFDQQQKLPPREFTEEEKKTIPQEENEHILKPSGTQDSIWIETEGKYGKYDTSTPMELIGRLPKFYSALLQALGAKTNPPSHIIYEGFKFGKKGDASIFRSKYNPSGGNGSGGKGFFNKAPKFLKSIMIDEPEQISAYLESHPDENWEYKDFKEGKVIVVTYKP